LYPGMAAMPPEMRIPDAFGPGIVVVGPEVPVPADAPLQDRLLGLLGRDPR
ncbi:MAG: TIGR03086 family protein, partial [Ilumatobacteraceae bacterium]